MVGWLREIYQSFRWSAGKMDIDKDVHEAAKNLKEGMDMWIDSRIAAAMAKHMREHHV